MQLIEFKLKTSELKNVRGMNVRGHFCCDLCGGTSAAAAEAEAEAAAGGAPLAAATAPPAGTAPPAETAAAGEAAAPPPSYTVRTPPGTGRASESDEELQNRENGIKSIRSKKTLDRKPLGTILISSLQDEQTHENQPNIDTHVHTHTHTHPLCLSHMVAGARALVQSFASW